MSDDRGQALVFVVGVLALAAVALAGLRLTQDRLVSSARLHRAGEAAVEAAAQSVADAYVSRRSAALTADPEARARAVADLVTDPSAAESARLAAEDLARENRAEGVRDVEIRCDAGQIHVWLVLAGHQHRAGFDAPECSRR